MNILSFDALRTYDFKHISYMKPEHLFKEKKLVMNADWIIYPPYWQVNTLVYGLKKNIFPNISTYHLGHNKVEMTRALTAVLPQNMPYTEILPEGPESRDFILSTFDFPFICKEVLSSMGNGVHLIEKPSDFHRYADRNDVLYVQEYLPIDRDLRITYVGDRIIGGYWRVAGENSFKNNVAQGGSIEYGEIPLAARQLVETAASLLNINHAGFDVAMVDGYPYLFEFNVMFGTEGLLRQNIDIGGAVYDYLLSLQPPVNPIPPIIGHKTIS